MKMQTKLLPINPDELKFSVNESGITTIKGYASVFGGIDSYGDTIIPGAYEKTLIDRQRPVLMRWNHFGPIIGKWTEIKEDEKGLYVEGELTPGHSVADDAAASLKHGAVDGLSIGFMLKQSTENGVLRELREIELIEISVVEEPADNQARIASVKSALQQCKSLKEVESLIRAQFKLSQTEATAIVASVKRVLHCDSVKAKEISAAFKRLTIIGEQDE